MQSHNSLTSTEVEALILLIEEAGEVVQAATKLLRHGRIGADQSGPFAVDYDNTKALNKEIADLEAVKTVVQALFELDGPSPARVVDTLLRKRRYIHDKHLLIIFEKIIEQIMMATSSHDVNVGAL